MRAEDSRIDCRCERAVVTAYLELRELGTSDVYAVQACITLYRIHHPQSSTNDARRRVTEWIDRGTGSRKGAACRRSIGASGDGVAFHARPSVR